MQEIAKNIRIRATQLLKDAAVARVIGWETGEGERDWSPALFETAEDMEKFVYGPYAGANLSKFCLKFNKAEGKTLVVLKPCDTLSFNQLLKEHRLERENFFIIGAGCKGMTDEEGRPLLKCETCKGKEFMQADEVIDDAQARKTAPADRFSEIQALENLTHQQRYDFWRNELSRCIRCNACRNVCPACTCQKCVFDNPASGVAAKANVTDFEENMFHIIRAYHVAGRCTDCGECSRVCPQNIPLHLLNRKFIKDMNEMYGTYQAGEGDDEKTPLTSYEKTDAEPSIIYERGNA